MCNEFAQERAWREYSEMMQREARSRLARRPDGPKPSRNVQGAPTPLRRAAWRAVARQVRTQACGARALARRFTLMGSGSSALGPRLGPSSRARLI